MNRLAGLVALVCSLLLVLSMSAFAAASSGSRSATNKTAKTTSANNTTIAKSSSHQKTGDTLAPPQDLSGTISFVGPSDKEVTLKGANGTPYDFDVTNKTKIDVQDKSAGPSLLPQETHKQATVRFLPTARGNVAQTITITG